MKKKTSQTEAQEQVNAEQLRQKYQEGFLHGINKVKNQSKETGLNALDVLERWEHIEEKSNLRSWNIPDRDVRNTHPAFLARQHVYECCDAGMDIWFERCGYFDPFDTMVIEPNNAPAWQLALLIHALKPEFVIRRFEGLWLSFVPIKVSIGSNKDAYDFQAGWHSTEGDEVDELSEEESEEDEEEEESADLEDSGDNE